MLSTWRAITQGASGELRAVGKEHLAIRSVAPSQHLPPSVFSPSQDAAFSPHSQELLCSDDLVNRNKYVQKAVFNRYEYLNIQNEVV